MQQVPTISLKMKKLENPYKKTIEMKRTLEKVRILIDHHRSIEFSYS
jgi:hypothetical protein